MAKKIKNQTPTASAPVPHTPENSKYKRLASVMVPTLKMLEGVPVFVHVNQAIVEKEKVEKDEKSGLPVTKTIEILNITNLDTGEIQAIVCGKALSQNLKDYKGGNQQYVGLNFEITKHPPAPGKRWKPYSLFEIEAEV